MKREYAAPTLATSGSLIDNTKSGAASPITLDGVFKQKNPSFGDLGFGL